MQVTVANALHAAENTVTERIMIKSLEHGVMSFDSYCVMMMVEGTRASRTKIQSAFTFYWKFLGPFVLVQSSLTASKCINCNLTDLIRIFMLLFRLDKNEVSNKITVLKPPLPSQSASSRRLSLVCILKWPSRNPDLSPYCETVERWSVNTSFPVSLTDLWEFLPKVLHAILFWMHAFSCGNRYKA